MVEQALNEISVTWKKAHVNGLEFGRCCEEWSVRLPPEELLEIYKRCGIKPSDAGWWIDRYRESLGFKKAKNERRVHRDDPDNFEDIRALALDMLRLGFRELEKDETKNLRQLRSAKDWAFAKLKSRLL